MWIALVFTLTLALLTAMKVFVDAHRQHEPVPGTVEAWAVEHPGSDNQWREWNEITLTRLCAVRD